MVLASDTRDEMNEKNRENNMTKTEMVDRIFEIAEYNNPSLPVHSRRRKAVLRFSKRELGKRFLYCVNAFGVGDKEKARFILSIH